MFLKITTKIWEIFTCHSFQPCCVLGTFKPGRTSPQQLFSTKCLNQGTRFCFQMPELAASCPCPCSGKSWIYDRGHKTYSLCNSSYPTRSTACQQNHPNPRSVISLRDQRKKQAWDRTGQLLPSYLQEQEIKILVNLKWSWQPLFKESFRSTAPLVN